MAQDVRFPLADGARLQILTTRDTLDPDALSVLRHSAAHLLAEAVRRLYPGVKMAIGPPIENGFYYDFEFRSRSATATRGDRGRGAARARRGAHLDPRGDLARRSASALRARGRAVQARARRHSAEGEISLYTQGEFTDLCRGPHLQGPRRSAVKLTRSPAPTGAATREPAADPHLRHRVLHPEGPRRPSRAARAGAAARPPPPRAASSTSSTSTSVARAPRSGIRRGW